ncbi:hypothetical protein [Actinoplanes derwentensis]|uniref:Uncharacterized protein n=1 Tax=Actinoplanes derwentensis TaxID=113562 RepID=A0A1H1XKY9_9ACTN|nr:hypothetical protein [Actinoplanes derwentensis]GID87750.1 hypothetical protein Ade03nite_66740 [Actinoplanes derwentensis]SDT09842.1 hypothetical protein SAMN04489716_2500 [Actinoplanes derwentensis]
MLARLAAVQHWNSCAGCRAQPRPGDLVNGVFIEQIAPGRLEQAAIELPRYIAALRLARRPATARGPG